jgi:hypothetical protein
VFSSVFQTKSYIERDLESSAKTQASTPLHQVFTLRRHSEQLSNFGIIFTRILFAKGGENSSIRAYISLKYPFLAIHAKGGESISPKQKDRTTTGPHHHLILQKNDVFKLVSYCVQKGEKVVFSKLVY